MACLPVVACHPVPSPPRGRQQHPHPGVRTIKKANKTRRPFVLVHFYSRESATAYSRPRLFYKHSKWLSILQTASCFTPPSKRRHVSSRHRVQFRASTLSTPPRSLACLPNFPRLPTLRARPARHGVECFTDISGPPIKTSPRRLTPEKLQLAKKYFDLMCAAGICRRSNSPWSSGLHMVAKKDGTSRPCGDYRRLNERTVSDAYPIPHLHDLTSDLAGCQFFSKIDLVKGYHQIPVRAADVPKTAIATPFGLFEFLCMPFGLKNATQTFQRLMDNVTNQLPGVFAYIDDVLVASPSAAQHESDLRRLFDALKRFGLVVNSSKCVFGARELEFLGHRVSARGIRRRCAAFRAPALSQVPPALSGIG